ncbi:DNA internalization-related competence protein ComEC/Rec2 [soil metagenome]
MRSAIIGFVIGVFCLQFQASLPTSVVLWALFVGAALATALAHALDAARVRSIRIFAIASAGAMAGFLWAALFAQVYLAQELPKDWEGRDVTVIGTIDSLPNYFEQGVRFNFLVERVLPQNGVQPILPPRISLSWYSGFRAEALQPIGDVQPGERWQLTVRLQRPHGVANPFGFDFEAWLLEQNLRATGSVRSDEKISEKNLRLTPFVFSFPNVVEHCRARLRERILAALPDKKYAGVIVALVVGDQRAVDRSDWKIFSRTGVSHLISISGLHITMIAGLFASLVFALWRRSFFTRASLPLRLPAQKAAAVAGAGIAFLYVLLAGFGVPAQRTLYMLIVVAAALWTGRITSVSHVLCMALGVVVVLDPWAVLWPGFWLSFSAVAIIMYASVVRMDPQREAVFAAAAAEGTGAQTKGGAGGLHRHVRLLAVLKSASHTQLVVTLGLLPFTMLLFGQVSLASPIANAVAIPVVSFLVTPLALVGSLLPAALAKWVLGLAHVLLEWLTLGLSWLSESSFAVWSAPIPSWWIFALALIGTLWLLAPRGWPLRWIGLFAWIPLLLNAPVHPKEGELWITALDVGQGMGLLIETSQHRMLYDTGPYYSPEADGGNRVILPYLKSRGINSLDAVIITHNDNDHSGGALSIFDETKIGWVASSLATDSKIVQKAPNHHRCEAGQGWTWDGVRFEMLHPTPGSYESTKWKPNARSCAVRITLGEHSVLLAGDIEAVQETELVGSIPDKLQAKVLLAPHHGSGTSSTLPFLQTVRPELAIFQVGYRNRYHHPKQEVFDRYGELGIKRLRSDESGAISLRFGAGMEMAEMRKEQARYWQGR